MRATCSSPRCPGSRLLRLSTWCRGATRKEGGPRRRTRYADPGANRGPANCGSHGRRPSRRSGSRTARRALAGPVECRAGEPRLGRTERAGASFLRRGTGLTDGDACILNPAGGQKKRRVFRTRRRKRNTYKTAWSRAAQASATTAGPEPFRVDAAERADFFHGEWARHAERLGDSRRPAHSHEHVVYGDARENLVEVALGDDAIEAIHLRAAEEAEIDSPRLHHSHHVECRGG